MEIKSKFLFKGRLKLNTAMHIGGGKVNLTHTDSPIVRTVTGIPYIPGSSFKGVFRSTVEKIVAVIPYLSTCQLIEDNTNCPSANQKNFIDEKNKKKWNEKSLANELEKRLCDTCKLFGSPFTASKIIFYDLTVCEWAGVTRIQDGVVIDRDSERAVDKLKYDFEVIDADSIFDFNILLENPTQKDVFLACTGLNEFLSGFGYIGGFKSRGLGNCQIHELKVYTLDLQDEDTKIEKLKKYLSGSKLEEKMDVISDAEKFIKEQINLFLSNIEKGVQNC